MYVIASNITTRVQEVDRIFRRAAGAEWDLNSGPAAELKELAKRCAGAGADALEINLQQRHDTAEAMEFAVKAVQSAANLPLFLSTASPEALAAGLKACKKPPVFNYISVDETRLKKMLPLVAKYKAGVILLASDPSHPADARDMLEKTAVLAGAANEVGIKNARIYVDPGLIHISGEGGQRHMAEVIEYLRALPDAADPAIKSTCWLASGSAGIVRKLRPVIDSALLQALAGAGLKSVFMDVLRPENRRALRLVKIFGNELVYADALIGL